MGSIAGDGTGVNLKAVFAGALKDAQQEMVRRVGEAVGQELDGAVKRMLGREAYERRERVAPWVEMAGVCHRCKSRQSQRFSRNGHREHRVLTLWGEVSVPVQRLVCECGGSVQLGLDGWLRPYQRVGDDVDEQIRRWGALRVSLREMQGELEQLHISPLALRTLNKRLHQIVTAANEPTPTSVPPVLQVDATGADWGLSPRRQRPLPPEQAAHQAADFHCLGSLAGHGPGASAGLASSRQGRWQRLARLSQRPGSGRRAWRQWAGVGDP